MAQRFLFSALAEHGVSVGPLQKDSTLVFNEVITNIGGAYNNTSGVFTAPVKGVYYFSFFYHADKINKSGLTLIKGKEPIVSTFDNNQSKHDDVDNAGNGAFIELNPGDEVYVMLPAQHQVWASDKTTSFSGHLIFQN